MNWKREPSYKEINVVIIKPARTTSTWHFANWKINNPSYHSWSHHQTSSSAQDVFQSTHLPSWYWAFSVKKKWQYESFLKLYKTEKSEVIFITFNSCTSTISFSKRSDSFRDFSSASLSSINCGQTTQIYSKIKCNVFE